MTYDRMHSALTAGLLIGLACILTGCSGSVSTDLSTDAPANTQIAQINVDVLGVEFQRTDGTTEKLEFTNSERTNLIALLDNSSSRLFTNEQLGDGTYSGVRLLLEDNDDATVVLTDGREFPSLLAEGDYTAVDFTVEEDKSSSRSLILTLDLRKSLSFDDDNDEYTLTPVLRAVDADDAGQVSGSVDVTCPLGTTLLEGGAVYVFSGEDLDPSELGGTGTAPYATTAVVANIGGLSSYAVRFLPQGSYTLALTCEGNLDSPTSSDGIRFLRARNITIGSEAVTHDITN